MSPNQADVDKWHDSMKSIATDFHKRAARSEKYLLIKSSVDLAPFRSRHKPGRLVYTPSEMLLLKHHGDRVGRRKTTWKKFEYATCGFRSAKEFQRKYAKLTPAEKLPPPDLDTQALKLKYRELIEAVTSATI